jgi:Protein of unknown function (DUF4236)
MMGIRLRKRIKLFPGIYINLSKSGISASAGVRGASVTVGNRKTRTNVGIPGTGISHNTITSNKNETTTPRTGMSMGKLLLYGIISLFLTILLLGLFHQI